MKLYNETLLNEMLDFIRGHQMHHGQSPTLRAIKDNFAAELSAVSVAERYVKVLIQRGLLQKENGQIKMNRNIAPQKTVSAPLVGIVACSNPTFAIEDIEQVYKLPTDLFGDHELFMLRAKGDSMRGKGIGSGDLVVVKKQSYAEYGQMVVALMGDDATVKTYWPEKENIILHPENAKFKDIIVNHDDCIIQGVVVGCIKTYN